MEKTFEIDLKRLGLDILSKIWIIILAAVVVAFSANIYAKKCLTPLYTASASLYVHNYIEGTNSSTKISSADISTSQKLVQTYLQFLSSDKVLDAVSKQLNGEYSSSQLRSMISAKDMDETEIFVVAITAADAEEAAKIVNVIADMAPQIITNYLEGSSVKVVDYAKVPKTRSFPVYRKYIVTGGAVGGGIALIVIILFFLFNSKIKSEEDIKRLFTAPIIGKIPSFDSTQQSGSSYKYEYRTHGKGRTEKGGNK